MLNIRQSPLTAILRDTSVTVLALLTLAFAHPARAQTYTVTDLGPNVMPRAVNIKGQVACEHPAALLLWSSGRSIVLKSGTFFKRACAINAIGQVVGSYDTGSHWSRWLFDHSRVPLEPNRGERRCRHLYRPERDPRR